MLRLLLYLSILLGCEPSQKSSGNFPYQLEKPTQRYLLPGVLKEVSGIILTEDEKNILCIEDNYGIIYNYDKEKNKVTTTTEVTGAGDFEDIAIVNDTKFILRSDGVIFEFGPEGTKEHKTFLSSHNNMEGMCYDKANNRLLLMEKDKSVSGNEAVKEVFAFDITTKSLAKNPVFTLTYDTFKPYANESKKNLKFKPSGLAIHPVTKEIYVISSTASALAVTDIKGKLLNFVRLDKSIFQQPEGICFDASGNLFISNEGRKGEPDILMFKYLAK